MNTPTVLARICAFAVLAVPLSLLGAINDETMRELKVTLYVEPAFPDSLRYEGIAEGHATLAVSRTESGEPGDVLVLNATHPKLGAAAVKAVREWRFAPTTRPEDLAARTVRIGFRLTGVIIFPFGRNHQEELAMEKSLVELTQPLAVPRLQSLSQAPKALAQPMPAYPATLASQGREGTAAVKFYVDEEGRVRIPEVLEATAPEFAAAAVAAVAQWRYEPPRAAGRPIVASEHWEFKFRANN